MLYGPPRCTVTLTGNYFVFQMNLFYFVVTICDLVRNEETIFRHCLLFTPFETRFYAPNFEKVGIILLSDCAFVRPSVRSKKIQARVLKFHIWIPRQK